MLKGPLILTENICGTSYFHCLVKGDLSFGDIMSYRIEEGEVLEYGYFKDTCLFSARPEEFTFVPQEFL